MSYTVKGAPFLFRGVVDVKDCKTSEEVMVKAGLDWEVAKGRTFVEMPYLGENAIKGDGFLKGAKYYGEHPNEFGVFRKDNNTPLGAVKGRYTEVQNLDAFKFFDDAIGKDSAIWDTAGCFGNGERVFVSAKLPQVIKVHGQPIENYLIFTTSHDGSSGIKILFSPMKIVCANTLNAAIKGSSNYVSFRHTASVHDNIGIASSILGITKQKIEHCDQAFDRLARIEMSDMDVNKMFANIILSDKEIQSVKDTGHTLEKLFARNHMTIEDTGISMKKVNILSELNDYYHLGPGQKETLNTAWGAYGAVTGYYCNVDNATGEKRMDSLLYGDKSRKIEAAGNYLLSL